MIITEFIPPTDDEIKLAEAKLGFKFPSDYVAFIKSGYDLGDAVKEGLWLSAEQPHLDIYQVRADARQYYGLPEELLPIYEDNADYYCLNSRGEVVFWSHDGPTDEKWLNVSIWVDAMIAEHG